MANECIVRSHRNGLWSLYFWYDIPPAQRKQIGGQNVVPTPSSSIDPVLISGPTPVITAAEQVMLDAGEAVLYPHTFRPDPSLDLDGKKAAARGIRTQKAQEALDEYKDRYQHVGVRFDG